jgi:ubiquinone/menaquinone biosynthesis C-methylase UbiE
MKKINTDAMLINDNLQKKLDKFYSYDEGDDLWTRYSHRKRIDCIKNLIPYSNYDKALDIGCGCGVYSMLMGKKGYSVEGIDINSISLSKAKKWANEENISTKVNFQNMDVHNLAFPDNYFDLIIASEVIEHLNRPMGALKEIARVLKPNGKLIVTMPNLFSLPWFIRKLTCKIKNLELTSDERQHIDFPFWKSMKMLQKSNLKIEFCSGVCLFPLNLRIIHKLLFKFYYVGYYIVRIIDDVISKNFPFKYINGYFLIMAKKNEK